MNRQSSKTSQNDIPPEAKDSAAEGQPERLVIPSREILNSDTSVNDSDDLSAHLELDPTSEDTLKPSTAPTLQPIDKDIGAKSKDDSSVTGSKQTDSSQKDDLSNKDGSAVDDSDGETIDVKVTPPSTKSTDYVEPSPPKLTTAPLSQPLKPKDEEPETKPVSDNTKSADQQVADNRREHEIENYIKNRQYYVPIDSVARKRSIKVSLGLTLIVIVLCLALLDLLLDSGAILLVQRIPHTHFFSNSSNN